MNLHEFLYCVSTGISFAGFVDAGLPEVAD